MCYIPGNSEVPLCGVHPWKIAGAIAMSREVDSKQERLYRSRCGLLSTVLTFKKLASEPVNWPLILLFIITNYTLSHISINHI